MTETADKKPEPRRGSDGKFIGNDEPEGASRKIDKEALRKSIGETLGLPVDDPIVQLITDLGTSRDKKDRMKIIDMLVKKMNPKQDEGEKLLVPEVLEALDIHLKYKTGELVEVGKKANSLTPLLEKIAQEREDLNNNEGYETEK